MSGWIEIQDAVMTDDIQQVHCDTRDFHAVFTADRYTESDVNTRPWWGVRHDPRFLISQNEVIPFLRKLEDMTGGRGEWRMMNFANVKTFCGWFKYVRLYRVSPTHFIVTDGFVAANVSQMNERNLDKEHLCMR